jgi:hypothetical protein
MCGEVARCNGSSASWFNSAAMCHGQEQVLSTAEHVYEQHIADPTPRPTCIQDRACRLPGRCDGAFHAFACAVLCRYPAGASGCGG